MMDIPAKMNVVEISRPGGPEVLVPATRPVPEPVNREILVKVAAAGVNRPDCLQRSGGYPPPPGASDIPGLEIAGAVVGVGDGASLYQSGDPVTALVPGGGYAEYAIVDERNALPVPASCDFLRAAAIPETFFTVWHNVIQRGRLMDGETLLVHGGASGIGTTAIQIAKARGATVIVTAGSERKCQACLGLGADHAINYKDADFVDQVREFTDGRGADVILDMVGGDYIPRNYDAAAEDGRIVQIAFLHGAVVETNYLKLMLKRLTHTGSTLRPRPVEFKEIIARELHQTVWPLIESRTIAPVMDMVFDLAQASQAHFRMEAGDHIGKIVLKTG